MFAVTRIVGMAAIVAAIIAMSLAGPALAVGGTGVIHGTITAPDGSSHPDGPVTVTLSGSTPHLAAADGSYSFSGISAGSYELTFDYSGSSEIVRHLRWDGTFANNGSRIALAAGEDRRIDVRLVAGATVSGALTGIDGAVDSATIRLVLILRGSVLGLVGTFDATEQRWSVSDVPPGSWRVRVSASPRWQPTQGVLAEPISEGVDAVDTPLTLLRATDIEGEVDVVNEGVVSPWKSGFVEAYQVENPNNTASADVVDGHYDLYPMSPGSYRICFVSDSPYYSPTCRGGGTTRTAPGVAVSDGQVLEGIDGQIVLKGALTGNITAAPIDGDGTTAHIWRWDEATAQYVFVGDVSPQTGWGSFSATALEPGKYRVQVFDGSGIYNPQYWHDARYATQSTAVVVTAGETTDLGSFALTSRVIDHKRVAGDDRFGTAVAISQSIYPSVPSTGVPVVYIADGLDFPDALAAGPAAAEQQGVVLLVKPDSIPVVLSAELTRLRPQRIVVVGGLQAVSSVVYTGLESFVSSASHISREGGADRYSTARLVDEQAFAAKKAPSAVIVTGSNFPDALAAGGTGAVVIPIDGADTSIDQPTRALIRDLGVQKVYIAGGPAVVSTGIEHDLIGLLGSSNVQRAAGADRYGTAVILDQILLHSSDFAVVTTGTSFPDALTAAPLAIARKAPLFLATRDCVPALTAGNLLIVFLTHQMILVGGTNSLSSRDEESLFSDTTPNADCPDP